MSTPTQAKTLRIERTFDATPIDLWAAWTDPKQYAEWFNPAPGMRLVIHEFDVRPGGRVRFDMPQPDGNKNPQEGVFHTLTPFTHIATGSPDKSFLLDVRFVEVDRKRTRMVIEVTGVPPEYHEMATKGWGQGLDKLEKLLATTPRATRTIRITRVLEHATPARAFAAWTDAATLSKWFSPIPGVDAHVRSLDARAGGRGHVTVKPPEGEEFGFYLHYLKLAPPHEIVFTCMPVADDEGAPPMTVRFAAEGARATRMEFESPGVPEAVAKDAEGGWNAFFDKLARLLAGRA